jgi:pyruvate formate lyase activating enzyme
MALCRICNESSPDTSGALGVCLACIRKTPRAALSHAMEVHRESRKAFGLPEAPPRDPQGVSCAICVNECQIPEGGWGYCGLRKNFGGRLMGGAAESGKLSWYFDALPSNCVGDRVCPGGTGAGYPEYAYRQGAERGYKNLAVFFHACSFNCLFCQNWHFKEETFKPGRLSSRELAEFVDDRTACVCYFGGDPSPQLPYSLNASNEAVQTNKDRILRICWETNGSMNPSLLDRMMAMALKTGGLVKFDLKAWDDNLHVALTGTTNKRTLENFNRAGRFIDQRPEPPPLIANTLIVPGYVDEDEIRGIAKFIASVNPSIPYSLLAFHPQFYMSDMPMTPIGLAKKCLDAAQESGLQNVRLGNVHLFDR